MNINDARFKTYKRKGMEKSEPKPKNRNKKTTKAHPRIKM